jgi:hypothetical protein
MRRLNTRIGLCAAIVVLAATMAGALGQKGGPVETGRGSTDAARRYLEGRWGLLTYDIYPHKRPAIRLNGHGSLTFDRFGNLDVQIRVDPETAALLDAAGIPSANGILSIVGRVVVDMQARTLTYFLEGQPPLGAPSGPLALNRPRHWRVDDDGVLTLITKGDAGELLSVGRWQKAP